MSVTDIKEAKNAIITRVVQTNKVVHADLAIGSGTVEQTRGQRVTKERMIEVMWIFRTVDAIRELAVPMYTRVALHALGPVMEFVYDADSGLHDNGNTVLKPMHVTGLGRWIYVPVVDLEARAMIAELKAQLCQTNS